MSVICDYCDKPAELVTGAEVYPHRPDLHHKKFWLCKPCDACPRRAQVLVSALTASLPSAGKGGL